MPDILRPTRQAAFAHWYSTDKNVSIFLGRPSRFSKSSCSFPPINLEEYFSNVWSESDSLDFYAESRWAAMCAALKEDCLELRKESEYAIASRRSRYVPIPYADQIKHLTIPEVHTRGGCFTVVISSAAFSIGRPF